MRVSKCVKIVLLVLQCVYLIRSVLNFRVPVLVFVYTLIMVRGKQASRTSVGSSDANLIESAVRNVLQSKDLIEFVVTAVAERVTELVVRSIEQTLKFNIDACHELKEQLLVRDKQIETLQAQLDIKSDELEQYQRRNSIRVFGVPETSDENTDDLVLQVAASVGANININMIDRSHRVGPKTDKPRPIIAKFTSYRFRQEIYSKKKNLKGSKITIREDLTASRLSVLRAAITRFGVRRVWSSDGTIIILKPDGTKHRATRIEQLPPA